MKNISLKFLIASALCYLSTSVVAQPFASGPGLFYLYAGTTMAKVNTTAYFDITVNHFPEANSTLSLEKDLDFPSTSPLLYLKAIFGGRFQLVATGMSLHRTGDTYLSKQFSFGDQSYTVGARVKSFFNTDYYSGTLRLSIIHNPLFTAGFSTGFRYLKLNAGIDATSNGVEFNKTEAFNIPMIVPGIHASAYVFPGFLVRGSFEYFELKLSGTKGKVTEYQFSAEYFLLKYLGAGIGYSYTDMTGTGLPDNDIYLRNVQYTVKGVNIFAALRF